MAGTEIQQNLLPNELELKDLLALFKKQIMLELNCHAIGQIQSFDSTKQTATATIVYKKAFFLPNATGNYEQKLVDYPILLDCPVVCLGGGNGALTFPIEADDECVVLFNDRDIDNWFAGASGGATATPRLHSFSDGIILVGIRSLANALVNYNADATELRSKDGLNKFSITDDEVSFQKGENKVTVDDEKATIVLGSSGVTVEVTTEGKLKIMNETGEFVASLVQLFTDVQSATAGGFPLVMPTFPTDLEVLQSFQE